MMIKAPNLSLLDPDLRSRIQSELQDGERLVWVGQPVPSKFARGAIPLVLFGLPWTAFAFFWVFMASGGFWGLLPGGMPFHEAPLAVSICFPLFGLPFILIGLGMLSSPFWMKRKARRTMYAITDQRAILWEAGFRGSMSIRSYTGEQLSVVSRTERADGSGNLILEQYSRRDSDGDRRTTTHGFMGIENVRQVEDILRETLVNRAEAERQGQ